MLESIDMMCALDVVSPEVMNLQRNYKKMTILTGYLDPRYIHIQL